jgi:hypothetical protein
MVDNDRELWRADNAANEADVLEQERTVDEPEPDDDVVPTVRDDVAEGDAVDQHRDAEPESHEP